MRHRTPTHPTHRGLSQKSGLGHATTSREHYEQKSIMYSTSIKSSETEHFTLFHCA